MSMFEHLNRPQIRRDRLRDLSARILPGLGAFLLIITALYLAFLFGQFHGAMQRVW
jgi:hypothetical protein